MRELQDTQPKSNSSLEKNQWEVKDLSTGDTMQIISLHPPDPRSGTFAIHIPETNTS